MVAGTTRHASDERERQDMALASLAHELRTPINAIMGYGQMLSQGVQSEELVRYADHLLEAAQLLDETVDAMLDLSLIRRGQIKLNEEWFDVRREISAALRIMNVRAMHRRITILADIDPDTPDICGDPRLIRQIITNLISNAMKYSEEEGRVTVATRMAENGDLSISVSDTGIGIPVDELERIFVPYDRLGMEGTDIPGTGLGLPISLALAELHGGTLSVTSTLEAGTKVDLLMPEHRVAARLSASQAELDFR